MSKEPSVADVIFREPLNPPSPPEVLIQKKSTKLISLHNFHPGSDAVSEYKLGCFLKPRWLLCLSFAVGFVASSSSI